MFSGHCKYDVWTDKLLIPPAAGACPLVSFVCEAVKGETNNVGYNTNLCASHICSHAVIILSQMVTDSHKMFPNSKLYLASPRFLLLSVTHITYL